MYGSKELFQLSNATLEQEFGQALSVFTIPRLTWGFINEHWVPSYDMV